MVSEKTLSLDVAVVGGGPAGITACLELSKSSKLRIGLFECDPELGGIPRSCHIFFGMRDLKRIYTGPAYARKLDNLIRKTAVNIHTETRVLDIVPGSPGKPHQLHVLSTRGYDSYESRYILLATGCFESGRSARRIPGTRPAGVFTTGTLQQLINRGHLKPGRRALIIGSEHVALSSILTLRRAGVSIAGLVEEDSELQTYPFVAGSMSRFLQFPIYRATSVKAILGDKRVEGVALVSAKEQKTRTLDCDTVIITGKFRPDSALIENTPIAQDPSTLGPVVDMDFRTSVSNIFAAGNLLRGADMHDVCALEGKLAARSILRHLQSRKPDIEPSVPIRAQSPIRYVVPQKITPTKVRKGLLSKLFPRPAIQVELTLRKPVIEAWSGNHKIWRNRYQKLIANSRVPLPVEKFDWRRVDWQEGLILKMNAQ